MGIIGSIGSAVGSAAGSVGRAAGGVGRSAGFGGAIRGGIEGGGGGLIGGSSISGLARFDTGRVFGRVGSVNEGPAGLADLQTTVPWQAEVTNPLGQANIDVLSQAEAVAAQAWNPSVITSNLWIPDPARSEARLWRQVGDDKRVEPAILPQAEPMVIPFVLPNIAPNILDFLKPGAVASPASEPAVQTEPQPGSGVANEVAPATMVQPALEEQALIEETITERDTAKQIDIVKEEIEEIRLKDVVDEEVMGNRIVGLTGIAEVVGAEDEGGEIEGNKIVALTPPETKDKRSGIIKENGPDGSWIETLEEIASRKFRSLTEAKKQIVEIIARKVPVKRGKDGKEAGSEAVARVLKYLFVKYQPAEQLIKRMTKKQKISAKEGQKPSLVETSKPQARRPRIEDFPPLAEAFPKAA